MTSKMTEERRNEIRRLAGLPVYEKSVHKFTENDARDLAELEAKRDNPNRGRMAVDDYYMMIHHIRRLKALRAGKNAWEYDPMGYAFSMQSN